MSPQAGSRLGPYELQAPIGAGGMGEVWRGKDTRLDRSVAIKILPVGFAQDEERRQRFEREAKTISSLNHPHICTLFDVGHEGDAHFLVMELLEGESLADRLQKGPLPLDQVVKFGAQVGEALYAAHKQGIVHRDLKPGNVMLTKTGAKLLDFGLARSGAGTGAFSDSTALPTEAKPLTTAGTILGTFQYMAPEQLEGAEADARTDLFALGALLYEMATARRAFEGKSKTSLIAAILSTQPPPISSIQPVMPPALDHVVKKCLEKDPDDRWQSAHDVASELRWIGDAGSQAGVPATLSLRRRSRERLAWLLAAGLGLLWLLTLVPATLHWRERAPESPPVRFTISPPDKTVFSAFDIPAVSPDGRRIVFLTAPATGRETLWMRSLDSLSAQQLPGTEGGFFPFWSPDARAVAFFADGALKKVEVAGGAVQTLCTTQGGGGGAWNQHGEILFASGFGPIFRVSAGGGEPKPATTLDKSREETQHRWPSFLPDGRHFLYLARGPQPAKNAVFVGSLDGSEVQQLVSADSPAVYAPPGYLLYVREGTLMARPFDAGKRRFTGDPSPVAEQIAIVGAAAGRAVSVSGSGVLAYRTGANLTQGQLAWFDRAGRRLGTLGEPADYTNPALSRDGTRVAVGRRDPKTSTRDIWLFEVERGTASRLTFDPADDFNAVFSPDGTRILFTSDRKGPRDIYWKASTGVGEDEPVLESQSTKSADDWSPDGRFVVYNTATLAGAAGSSGGTTDLWVAPLDGDRKPMPFLVRPFTDSQAQISPDGRWITYSSDESGTQEVYVMDFPKPTGKWKVSTEGGAEPRWRRDGRELIYIAGRKLMAADIRTEGVAFHAGVPRVLFEPNLARGLGGRNRYVVSPDGQRFLMIAQAEQAGPTPLTVVENWR
jgi:serine/threonine protein kinase/Tol biopolymer transport system component